MDAERCMKCVPGKVLSMNRKFCDDVVHSFEYIDENCGGLQENWISICNRCQAGYFFENSGKCVKCETSENCLFCNHKDKTKCVVCKLGSYMNTSGQCI